VNAHLQLLDLSKNDLYRGVLAIASALDENGCLTSLNLADSSLGQDDLGHFLEPMKANKTLLDLQVTCAEASSKQLEAEILRLVARNKEISRGKERRVGAERLWKRLRDWVLKEGGGAKLVRFRQLAEDQYIREKRARLFRNWFKVAYVVKHDSQKRMQLVVETEKRRTDKALDNWWMYLSEMGRLYRSQKCTRFLKRARGAIRWAPVTKSLIAKTRRRRFREIRFEILILNAWERIVETVMEKYREHRRKNEEVEIVEQQKILQKPRAALRKWERMTASLKRHVQDRGWKEVALIAKGFEKAHERWSLLSSAALAMERGASGWMILWLRHGGIVGFVDHLLRIVQPHDPNVQRWERLLLRLRIGQSVVIMNKWPSFATELLERDIQKQHTVFMNLAEARKGLPETTYLCDPLEWATARVPYDQRIKDELKAMGVW
jgi:hypothetical protein